MIVRMFEPLCNNLQHRPELVVSCCNPNGHPVTYNIEDVLRDPFMLMGAPVSRRTARTVRQRRRAPQKLIPHRTDLEPCPVCGNSKIRFYLCTVCLKRVMAETFAIQEEMKKQYSNPFVPITKEIEVRYENDQKDQAKVSSGSVANESTVSLLQEKLNLEEDDEKIVLQMSKKRPSWFFN